MDLLVLMRIYRVLFLLPLIALAACSTIKLDPYGQTQATYSMGTFKMVFNSNAAELTDAALKGLESLSLYPTSVNKDRFKSTIQARGPKDKKITLEIYEINSVQTMLEIHWGAMGDRDSSLLLYNAIEANMPRK